MKGVKVIIIAACDRKGAIGSNGALPWVCPADMRRFVALTTNKVVVMGRKTADSLAKPLKNRINVVMTRDTTWSRPGFIAVQDAWGIRQVLKKHNQNELWVIGGAEIYTKWMPQADVVHLSVLDMVVPNPDAWFPLQMLDRMTQRTVIPCVDPKVTFWVMTPTRVTPKQAQPKKIHAGWVHQHHGNTKGIK